VSAPQRRQGVALLKAESVSERRSCALAGISRSSYRYVPHPREDAWLAERLQKLSKKRKRYGYRRAWASLRRQGHRINHKRVERVWRAEGLSLKKRRRRKRSRPGGSVPCRAEYPNHVWTYDFIHDACLSGQKLKMLTVVDEFTRECLAIETGTSIRAQRVMDVLEGLFAEHGPPAFVRSDNGPEFIARTLRQWLAEEGTQTLYIDPGSPWQNAHGESFHSRFRDECLNAELFANVQEAKVVIEQWRRDYNQERPHSSLGYLTPAEFKAAWYAEHAEGQRLGLPYCGPPDGQEKGQSSVPCPSVRIPAGSVRSPASALGSVPTVALSSERAGASVP
jgi:putative transposase